MDKVCNNYLPFEWKLQEDLLGPGKETKYTSALLLTGKTVRAADWWNTKCFINLGGKLAPPREDDFEQFFKNALFAAFCISGLCCPAVQCNWFVK
jgi:hypothetical protein